MQGSSRGRGGRSEHESEGEEFKVEDLQESTKSSGKKIFRFFRSYSGLDQSSSSGNGIGEIITRRGDGGHSHGLVIEPSSRYFTN